MNVREGYMREGPDHTDDALYKTIAKLCAMCACEFPVDPECRNCKYNGARYNGGDITRAELLRVAALPRNNDAASVYFRMIEKRHSSNINFWTIILLGVMGLFGWMIWIGSHQQPVVQPVVQPNNLIAINKRIYETCQRVQRNVSDLNHDGKINCQDYTALFHRYWPGSDIMYNAYIGPTGHVFIRIVLPDAQGVYFVEPQGKGDQWAMSENWAQWAQVKNNSIIATEKYAF